MPEQTATQPPLAGLSSELPEGVEKILTHMELSNTPGKVVDDMRLLIFDTSHRQFWRAPHQGGFCTLQSEAHIYDGDSAWQGVRLLDEDEARNIRYYVLKPVPPPPDPSLRPGQKCKLEAVLRAPLIDLLKAAPLNEEVRSQVHAVTLVPVPEDKKTFEEVKDWIEMNITPKIAPPKPGGTNVPRVRMRLTETEYGTCHYTDRLEGQSSYSLSNDELFNIASECDDFGEFEEKVREALESKASEDPPSTDSIEGPEHNNYSPQGDQDMKITVNDSTFEAQLKQWMLREMPDTSDDWGI